MSEEARDRTLALLNAGDVSIGAVPAGAAATTDGLGNVVIGSGVVEGYSVGDLAFVVSHETQHVDQVSGVDGFFRAAIGGWADLLGIKSYGRSLERDAYSYSCANSRGFGTGYRKICSTGLDPQ